jgi:hypothetical protein
MLTEANDSGQTKQTAPGYEGFVPSANGSERETADIVEEGKPRASSLLDDPRNTGSDCGGNQGLRGRAKLPQFSGHNQIMDRGSAARFGYVLHIPNSNEVEKTKAIFVIMTSFNT